MRTWLTWVIVLMWSAFAQASFLDENRPQTSLLEAPSSNQLLPAEQAFIALEPSITDGSVNFELQVAPGYYAYRDRFFVKTAEGRSLEGLEIPAGEIKSDPSFGDVHVLKGLVSVKLPEAPAGMVTFGFQGCAEQGVCYPAMTKEFDLGPGQVTRSPKTVDHTPWWFFLAGVGLAFTPCVLPTLPLLLRVVSGQAANQGRSAALAGVFVVSSSLGYALLGMLVSFVGGGAQLQAHLQNPVVILTATAVFIMLALTLLEVRGLRIPVANIPVIQRLYQRMSGGSILGAAGLGLISTLVLSPCVSAPLAALLLYLAQGGNPVEGAISLFALGIGMGLPMMILATGGQSMMPKSGPWMLHVKRIYAALLLITAAVLLSRILQPRCVLILEGIIAGGMGIWLYTLSRQRFGIMKGLASVMVGFGLISFMGAWKGYTNPLAPWEAPVIRPYSVVTTVSQLDGFLAKSTRLGQPVMIDISANWCMNCKVLEARLLAPDVQEAIHRSADWVKFDITDSTPEVEAWLKSHNLFGPPALMFIDSQGREVVGAQLIGDVEADDVVKVLSDI